MRWRPRCLCSDRLARCLSVVRQRLLQLIGEAEIIDDAFSHRATIFTRWTVGATTVDPRKIKLDKFEAGAQKSLRLRYPTFRRIFRRG